ncbi:G-box-binding factor 4-like [Senna tora]|uniref:G-box-binding factor 4-like n=1 Tax=Senna tora TaxID=362788 RepID=A0A834WG19_9FABA|nr:G-box-binding factor 4-like [Senna tora]
MAAPSSSYSFSLPKLLKVSRILSVLLLLPRLSDPNGEEFPKPQTLREINPNGNCLRLSARRPQSTVSDKKISRSNLGSLNIDGILNDVYESGPSTESTLLDAQITLIDTPANTADGNPNGGSLNVPKTMDDVWKDMISGDRRECKVEAMDEMMTLEDFLAKSEAVEDDDDVKMPVLPSQRLSGGVFTFDPIPPSSFQALDKVEGSVVGFGNGVEVSGGRNKRGRTVLEPVDKATQQRQRRMIKNRESAARSRERKQAYQVELESIAVRLEEENEQLMKEKAERTKKRYKQLMEKVIPIVEKQRQSRTLRRFLRAKVLVDPSKPLFMGAFIPLSNSQKVRISCMPERTFRVCEQCGRIGHLPNVVTGVCLQLMQSSISKGLICWLSMVLISGYNQTLFYFNAQYGSCRSGFLGGRQEYSQESDDGYLPFMMKVIGGTIVEYVITVGRKC